MKQLRKQPFIRLTIFVAIAVFSISAPLAAQQTTAAKKTLAKQPIVPKNLLNPVPPTQPLPYSHKTHVALGLACQSCHVNPEPGKLMTFPATSICMSCHVTVAKDKPSIVKLAEFAKSDQPIPWVRVYSVLPGVNWNHRAHLTAGLKCETCHGQISQMSAVSEVTSVTTMAVCITCHEQQKAPSTCNTCHGWPAGAKKTEAADARKEQ